MACLGRAKPVLEVSKSRVNSKSQRDEKPPVALDISLANYPENLPLGLTLQGEAQSSESDCKGSVAMATSP